MFGEKGVPLIYVGMHDDEINAYLSKLFPEAGGASTRDLLRLEDLKQPKIS